MGRFRLDDVEVDLCGPCRFVWLDADEHSEPGGGTAPQAPEAAPLSRSSAAPRAFVSPRVHPPARRLIPAGRYHTVRPRDGAFGFLDRRPWARVVRRSDGDRMGSYESAWAGKKLFQILDGPRRLTKPRPTGRWSPVFTIRGPEGVLASAKPTGLVTDNLLIDHASGPMSWTRHARFPATVWFRPARGAETLGEFHQSGRPALHAQVRVYEETPSEVFFLGCCLVTMPRAG